MKRLILLTCLLAFVSVAEAWAKRPGRSFRRSFVQVSARDPRYFCLSDGQPYIPVGCNIAAMGSVADMEHYLGKMHRNGANFGRVWLNTNLFEIETRYGEGDTAKLVRIDRLLELADRYGIKIKFCIESFRHIRPGVNKWDTKASYHTSNGGPFADADDYITSQRGEEEFLRRVCIFRERYGDHPAVERNERRGDARGTPARVECPYAAAREGDLPEKPGDAEPRLARPGVELPDL